MVTILVAMDEDRVIGCGNKLPWHLSEDLKIFRRRTTGNTVIMGRKTWQSLPKPYLPERLNFVITREQDRYRQQVQADSDLYDPLLGPHFADTIELAVSRARREFPEYVTEIYLMGGAQLYELALRRNLVDKMIVTHVEDRHVGDVLFPKWGPVWKVGETEQHVGFHITEYYKA